MGKTRVKYFDENANLLFQEEKKNINIPPIGRVIIWHTLYWKISEIIEDWDKNTITITLRTLED
ncbi:MAG: hypothetical protein BM557_01375 [Flavobacterium sp. MedPE-SWcel]|uniref:hypothetical protein n=1 Tax=uncultured Flavobacterium sp. TaxID=165435 RepID=UPI00091424B9|nr:hypothetical protein [uncultured Flavobacterium sp.]OIQ22057.1 MAG: hypothetical protein BM557_01375 [Flavobacterium sp. MedPE-SWcel]